MSGKQAVQSCDCSACFPVVRIKIKNQLKNLTLTLITKHSYSKKYSLEMNAYIETEVDSFRQEISVQGRSMVY